MNSHERKAIMRDKRAQGIAAMGLVTRQGDRFQIKSPSIRGRTATFEVWRDESGKVNCSCLEFEESSQTEKDFRCEHILAVKHHLAAKPTITEEGISKMKGQPKGPGARPGGADAPTPKKTTADPLHPSATVLTHLGSLVVHLEEFLDSIPGGAASVYSAASFDVAAIRTSLDSQEVQQWREGMKRLALLPAKRSEGKS